MKKWKKSLAALLSAAMLLGLLAACDSGEKPSGASGAPDATPTPAAADGEYPITPEELGSGEVKWSEEKTADGWMKVTNQGGATLGYSPDSGVKLIQVDGLAFKDLNRNGKLDLYEDWRQDAQIRAERLAEEMNIAAIAGLMLYSNALDVSSGITESDRSALDFGVRSFLNFAEDSPAANIQAEWNNEMQAYAENSAFGIPVMVGTNPRSGGVSSWPNNLALAATFDPNIAREAANQLAKEYRTMGITSLLGPQIDLASEPRWRRVDGTFGEDPALSRDMTSAFILGTQATFDDDGQGYSWGSDSVYSMMKHYPGDGVGEAGREAHVASGKYNVYPGNALQTQLIPFIDGGLASDDPIRNAAGVMPSYSIAFSDGEELGELVGSAFSEYKISILREKYGYNGVICTDWNVTADLDNPNFHGWGTEELTLGERYYKAVVNDVDQFGAASDPTGLLEAYDLFVSEQGEDAAKARFAQSASRILLNFFRLKMFENSYVDTNTASQVVGGEEAAKAGYEAKLKSIVMLKNENSAIKPSTNNEKPTVYIPMQYKPGVESYHWSVPTTYASWDFPIDLKTANQYFNVVTDTVSESLTGPADETGKPTPSENDIIRASKEELETCDFALILVTSPMQIPGGTMAGYDGSAGRYLPISLQYGPYTALSDFVRSESISGDIEKVQVENVYGIQYVNQKENRTYYGNEAQISNKADLDTILFAAENMPEDVPVIVAVNAQNPMIFSEFESQVDAILVGFGISNETFLDIVAGNVEPTALLPFQMPANMETVEAQYEDVPRDMECHDAAAGNTYDFGFGMNWSGVIQDERTAKYCVPPLTEPAAQPIQ